MKLPILHLEDSVNDAELIENTLINSGLDVRISLVSSRAPFEAKILDCLWSVILCDMSLPDYDGNSALEFVKAHSPDTPFIFVTGEMGEEVAIDTLRRGATDYVLKHHLSALVPAIARAVEESNEKKQRILAEDASQKNQRRLDSLYRLAMMDAHNEAELITYALEECIGLTDSALGFLHFVHQDQVRVERSIWSPQIPQHCTDQDRGEVLKYQSEIWANCIRSQQPLIQNKCDEEKSPNGCSHEQMHLHRHMCIPIIEDDLIVLVAGVGSKEFEYDINDVRVMQLLLVELWRIIKRRRGQVELRKLSRAVEFSPASILITDPKGTIEYVNPKTTEITQYSASELIGQTTKIFSSGTHTAEFYQGMWDTITNGRAWSGDLLNKRKDGNLYWEHAAIAPVLDRRGNITNFVAVKEDISVKKEAEIARKDALEQAERASKLKDIFIGMISHEIRTPLNIIMGFSGLLKEDCSALLPVENQFYFDAIAEAGDRLTRTIEMTLNLSELESGTYEPELCAYDLPLVLEPVIAQFIPAAMEKDLYLELHVDGRDLTVEIDLFGFEQAIMHLIDNAIKYTKGGGVFVNLYRMNGDICVDVRDTGIGISAETLQSIYAPFAQVESGYARQYEGVGVGLTLARRYIRTIGGEITVTSEPGKGSCFHIAIPHKNEDRSPGGDRKHGVVRTTVEMHPKPKVKGGVQ